MRQNEREIRSLLEWEMLLGQQASSRENRHSTVVLSPLFYTGYKDWDKGLVDPLWIG